MRLRKRPPPVVIALFTEEKNSNTEDVQIPILKQRSIQVDTVSIRSKARI